jgi:type II secretory pathway pseudopilin PulG
MSFDKFNNKKTLVIAVMVSILIIASIAAGIIYTQYRNTKKVKQQEQTSNSEPAQATNSEESDDTKPSKLAPDDNKDADAKPTESSSEPTSNSKPVVQSDFTQPITPPDNDEDWQRVPAPIVTQ